MRAQSPAPESGESGAGVILVGLQATFDQNSSQLSGSDKVWTLHLDQRPDTPQETAEAAGALAGGDVAEGSSTAAGEVSLLQHVGAGCTSLIELIPVLMHFLGAGMFNSCDGEELCAVPLESGTCFLD